jgi:hypothetical protein
MAPVGQAQKKKDDRHEQDDIAPRRTSMVVILARVIASILAMTVGVRLRFPNLIMFVDTANRLRTTRRPKHAGSNSRDQNEGNAVNKDKYVELLSK